MLYQSFALLAVTLASVSAFPTQVAKRDFVHDANGNIKILFSDQTVKLGTIPIDQIISQLAAACSTQGQCDTSPIDIRGQLVGAGKGGEVDGETLTVNPSGSYPTWIHNGLIDALGAAVKAAAKCEDVTHVQTCYNAMSYCPENRVTVNECTVPQYWGINYQTANSSNAAPPSIGADMSIKLDSDDFCSTLTTIGTAVAGAVNGAAGGIFTLLSLTCKNNHIAKMA